MRTLRTLFGDEADILLQTNFQLVLASTTFPVLGTLLISPMLDSLVEPFGTTTTDIGLLISAMTAPGVVMIPVAGVIADRVGRKPVLVVALMIFGLSGAAIALTTDFRVALALRFLQGVGFAGIGPILITSIRDQYDGNREATAQGLRLSFGGLSGAFFPLLSGALVVVAWQYPFLLYLTAVPVAAAVLVWYEDPASAADGSRERTGRVYARALLGTVRQPTAVVFIIARALPNVVWIGFYTYNSVIVIQVLGEAPVVAGLLAAVGNVVFAVAASQSGRIAGRFSSPVPPVLGANVLLGAGFSLVLFAPNVPIAVTGITLMGAGTGVLLSLYRSLITGLAPQSLRSGVVSIAESAGRVANTLTPVALGGAIAAMTPEFGLAGAIRATGVATLVAVTLGGIVCILLAGRLRSSASMRPHATND